MPNPSQSEYYNAAGFAQYGGEVPIGFTVIHTSTPEQQADGLFAQALRNNLTGQEEKRGQSPFFPRSAPGAPLRRTGFERRRNWHEKMDSDPIFNVVAPFGGADVALRQVRERVLAGHKVKALQPAPDGSGVAVVEW